MCQAVFQQGVVQRRAGAQVGQQELGFGLGGGRALHSSCTSLPMRASSCSAGLMSCTRPSWRASAASMRSADKNTGAPAASRWRRRQGGRWWPGSAPDALRTGQRWRCRRQSPYRRRRSAGSAAKGGAVHAGDGGFCMRYRVFSMRQRQRVGAVFLRCNPPRGASSQVGPGAETGAAPARIARTLSSPSSTTKRGSAGNQRFVKGVLPRSGRFIHTVAISRCVSSSGFPKSHGGVLVATCGTRIKRVAQPAHSSRRTGPAPARRGFAPGQ